jgi:hypothetical protein
MVMGIISIVFAAIGVLGSAVSVLMVLFSDPEILTPTGFSSGYMVFSTVLGIVFAIWLLVAGIGLVRYRKWGRLNFNLYAVITIVLSISQSVYMLVNVLGADFDNPAQQAGMIGGSIGGLLGLIFPIVGLVFLNLPSVRASLR